MSATYTEGAYEIGPPLPDDERGAYYVRVGVKTKKGLDLHYTCFGRSKEQAENRAKILARIMTALRPHRIKLS